LSIARLGRSWSACVNQGCELLFPQFVSARVASVEWLLAPFGRAKFDLLRKRILLTP
jgi:hypothetical protein